MDDVMPDLRRYIKHGDIEALKQQRKTRDFNVRAMMNLAIAYKQYNIFHYLDSMSWELDETMFDLAVRLHSVEIAQYISDQLIGCDCKSSTPERNRRVRKLETSKNTQ
jgi:hypothetical protein